MTECVFDAETHDPLLKKYGSGWVFKYHYPEIAFEVLGFGAVNVNGLSEYIVDNKDKLRQYLQQHKIWIFHNAAYDLGCLMYIFREELFELWKDVEIRDTMLMLKIHDQQLPEKSRNKSAYSLENACIYYNLVQKKESDLLHDHAWNTGLYQEWQLTKTGRKCHKKPRPNLLESFCKSNLKHFPVKIVGDYCLQDCKATLNLYQYLLKYFVEDSCGLSNLKRASDIIKICLKSKLNGCRIDLKACNKLSEKWKEIAIEAEDKVFLMLGCSEDFNINSGAKLGKLLEQDGYKIPRTDAGNYSIKAEWLDEQSQDIFKEIKRYRKAGKAEKDYIQKLIKYQEIIPEKYKKPGIGWLYPTLKPFGATLTGRFSSGGGQGCLELNVLAISSHDEEFGVPVREIFLPYENETLICADFSNQEPRFMVHYAKLLNCTGIDKIVDAWNENPKMKYHQKVADESGLPYDEAKTTTLGLAYDQREKGLSIKLNKSIEYTRKLIAKYYEMLPFMQELQTITASNLKRVGYIRTIDGRKLYIDLPYYFNGRLRTQERKAMSKLMQGSGAGQTMESMIKADKAGLKIMLCVHDEIIISSANPEVDKLTLVDCMENSFKLVVPVVAEVGTGKNWYDAKP